MERGVKWEDEWEEEEGQIVRELGRRMIVEQWPKGSEAMVKERRVTWRGSMTFKWVAKYSIAPELSQIQPCSSYVNPAKCNSNETTTAAKVSALVKCVCQKVKPVPVSDRSIPGAGHNWRERAIARAKPILGLWNELFIPKLTHGVGREG
jgi:hypothetical protein